MLRAFTLSDEHGRKEVAQVVEPDIRQSRFVPDWIENVIIKKIVRIYQVAFSSDEDQVLVVHSPFTDACFKPDRSCNTFAGKPIRRLDFFDFVGPRQDEVGKECGFQRQ
jgi:hypothetical protein